MTEPHKRPYRHPTDKTAYRVNNWRAYDQALRDRGDITLWISHDAIAAWTPPHYLLLDSCNNAVVEHILSHNHRPDLWHPVGYLRRSWR